MLAARYVGILILLFSFGVSAETPTFEKIIVFGDDSTDSGNYARWSDLDDDGVLNRSNTYFNKLFADGRATNYDSKKGNLLAVELLAKQLGLTLQPSHHLTPNVAEGGGTNFSVIGARSFSTGSGQDLADQVSSFLRSNSGQHKTTLFVLSVGSNDVRDISHRWSDAGMPEEVSPHEAEARLSQAAESIRTQLTRLMRGGAEHFLVINVADVGTLPETHLISEYLDLESELKSSQKLGNPIASAGVRTRIFNMKLSQVLSELTTTPEGRHVEVHLFDLFDHLAQIKKDALLYGLINIEDACVDSASMQFTKNCSTATANKFLYFNEIHFSQAAHQLISGGLYDSIITWAKVQER